MHTDIQFAHSHPLCPDIFIANEEIITCKLTKYIRTSIKENKLGKQNINNLIKHF